MKYIKLNKGMYAIVDDEYYEYLSRWKWRISHNGYAVRTQHVRLSKNKYKSIVIRMHRLVNNTDKGKITDHINQNKLDNRCSNLRTVDKSMNGFNRPRNSNNKSGYKGVYFEKYTRKWRAEIKVNYRKFTLGRFNDIESAAIARKSAERRYYAI